MDLIGAFGKKPKPPVRTEDNLLSDDYLEVIIGLTEGPIKGLVPGDKPDRPLENFFIDETPLQNEATGMSNFSDFQVDIYNGYENDGAIQNKLGGVSSNLTIGVRLAQNMDVIRQTPAYMRGNINQLEVRILFNQLMVQNEKGVFEGTAKFTIAYKLSTSSTWSFYNNEGVTSITGKTTNGYAKDFIIPVPLQSSADYDVRVTKLSADNSTTEFVELTWESLQMTTLGARAYPYVAVAHLHGKSSGQFQSLPQLSGIYDGLIVKVPTNYNPDTRTYSEGTPWNGTFKEAYTNNPAWVLYDAITNVRYGLARYYKNVAANRYEFYEAAKWCDEWVSNGQGGLQPRFTFNDLITDLRPGLEALRYIAGSFNSVIYDDGNGTIRLAIDKYRTPVQVFTPENVSKEGFNYTFTDITTRVNDVTVSFVNPDMEWGDDRRVANLDTTEWKEANGIIPEEFTAVGCTDIHEGLRRANYRLLTANTEVTMVSFMTSRLGCIAEIFKPIYVADPDAGWSTPGRIKRIADGVIHLRDPIYFPGIQTVTLKVQTYEGLVEVQVTPQTAGAVYALKIISGTLPASLPDRTVFTAEGISNLGFAKPFKVLSIENPEGNPDLYQITALEINVNKYSDADANTISEPVTYSFRKPGMPLQAEAITIESGTKHLLVTAAGALIPRIYISWFRPPRSYIDHYEIEYQESNSGMWTLKSTYEEFLYIGDVVAGRSYDIRITSVSILGVRSQPITIFGHVVIGKEEPPPDITGLIMSGDNIVWDEIKLTDVPDLQGYLVRFHYGANTDWGTASKFHDGFLTQSPYSPPFKPTGEITVLVKARDTSGHESVNAAKTTGDLGVLDLPNTVQSFDFHPTFPGTYTGCSLVSGELVATGLDSFYGSGKSSFYGTGSAPFYNTTGGYGQMVYTTGEIIITGATAGSVTALDLIADGSSVTIEYRKYKSGPFYGAGTDPFYKAGYLSFYDIVPDEWRPWRGMTALINGRYQFRITITSGTTQGKISLMKLLVTTPDRYEELKDVTISSSGTVVPYTLTNVNGIKTVHVTPQSSAYKNLSVQVDKTSPLAPVIFVYNSGVAVDGVKVDITIGAY